MRILHAHYDVRLQAFCARSDAGLAVARRADQPMLIDRGDLRIGRRPFRGARPVLLMIPGRALGDKLLPGFRPGKLGRRRQNHKLLRNYRRGQ